MPLSFRHLLVGLVALSLPATFMLATSQSTAAPGVSTTDSSVLEAADAKKKKKKQKRRKRNLNVRSLPQIAQPGAKPANANRARAVFTGTLRPGGKGRNVVVQIRNGKRWKQVARGKTVAKGAFHVTAPARKGKKYRVVAPRTKKLRKATSKVVSVDQWLKPTFQDQFNGKKLNKRWVVRGQQRQPLSKRGCSKGDRRAMRVNKGTLRLTVRKDPGAKRKCEGTRNGRPSGVRHSYRLNGHVGTDGTWSFRYGFAAARMKMHKSRGQHSSFWLQPDTPGRIPTAQWGGAEVDIIEYMGDKHPHGGITHSLYAYRNKKFQDRGGWLKNHRQYLNGPRDGWSKNYHVFSVEWTPKQYIFRIDGKETWRTNFGVSQVPQYVILSILSSDYELHLLGNEKKLPQHTHVDWVRVWELPRR